MHTPRRASERKQWKSAIESEVVEWDSRRNGLRVGGARKQPSGRVLERLLNEGDATVYALPQRPFELALARAQGKKFIGNVQRREHGHAQRIYCMGGFGHIPHLVIHELGQFRQVSVILVTMYVVRLTVNFNFHAGLPPSIGSPTFSGGVRPETSKR
jgi:hypothetical protein